MSRHDVVWRKSRAIQRSPPQPHSVLCVPIVCQDLAATLEAGLFSSTENSNPLLTPRARCPLEATQESRTIDGARARAVYPQCLLHKWFLRDNLSPQRTGSCLLPEKRGTFMSRKVGQIIARGERRWLVRVYLGRDRDTRKRTYHNRPRGGSAIVTLLRTTAGQLK